MTEARRQTVLFVMAEPERVMAAAGDESALDADTVAALQAVLQNLDEATVATALALLLPQPTQALALADDEALDCHRSDDPHDTFFRIARSHQGPLHLQLTASLLALQLFLAETPLPCERHDYLELGQALQQVLAEVLESALPGSAPLQLHAPQPSPLPMMRAADPLRRWVRGHQIFAVLTQGLIRRLHHVVAAVEANDVQALSKQLQAMAALYRASALGFRFTADFDPEIYSGVIRPSMCEPYTPKGFSGTLSSDHGVLVKLLVGHREALATAAARCPQDYADMRQAIAAVYDDHKWVCARFDGDRSPSLRTSSAHGNSTAVDMLDRFQDPSHRDAALTPTTDGLADRPARRGRSSSSAKQPK